MLALKNGSLIQSKLHKQDTSRNLGESQGFASPGACSSNVAGGTIDIPEAISESERDGSVPKSKLGSRAAISPDKAVGLCALRKLLCVYKVLVKSSLAFTRGLIQ